MLQLMLHYEIVCLMMLLNLPSGKRLHNNYGQSPFIMGKLTIKLPCSIAMLNYWRVYDMNSWKHNRIFQSYLYVGQAEAVSSNMSKSPKMAGKSFWFPVETTNAPAPNGQVPNPRSPEPRAGADPICWYPMKSRALIIRSLNYYLWTIRESISEIHSIFE